MENKGKVLLYEGSNDYHVIGSLLKAHYLMGMIYMPKRSPEEESGFPAILEQLPLWIKEPSTEIIAIVVDADSDLKKNWMELSKRLQKSGYENLPEIPSSDGQIITAEGKPKIGVWIMPDNQINGMLEDFIIHLIPTGDQLHPIIIEHLQQVEDKGLNRYNKELHHSKALIHAWLACQETPGVPMGNAINYKYLDPKQPIAQKFVAWLKTLCGA